MPYRPFLAVSWSVLIFGFANIVSAFRTHQPETFTPSNSESQSQLQKLQHARDAIKVGDVHKLRALLEADLDPNSPLATGCEQSEGSLVHTAALYGKKKCLKELIRRGAALEKLNLCGEAPIHKAAEHWDGDAAFAVVTLLANEGVHLDVPNDDGLTAMHIAAARGNFEAMRVLADMGCRVNAADKDWLTPLHYAAVAGEEEVVAMLLARGANIDARDGSGATAAHFAAKANQTNTLTQLVDAGVGVQAVDDKGKSLVHYAVSAGALDCLTILHGRGASLDVTDRKGRTPLHVATMKNQLLCLRFLVDQGADVNVADIEHETPLHYAVRQAHLACLEELVEAGGRLDLVNKFGETLADIAQETEDDDIMAFLNVSHVMRKSTYFSFEGSSIQQSY